MTANATRLGLLGCVTTDTALIDIWPVHGLFEGDTATIFVSLKRMTLLAVG
jgi:hypothetical protein